MPPRVIPLHLPEGLGLAGGGWCDQELSANCRDQEQRKLKKLMLDVFFCVASWAGESSFQDGRCKVPSAGAVKSAECGMMSAHTAGQTDSARTRGLGSVLQQRHGDTWQMVQCGSRLLTDTESRCGAVVELACLWALRKCHIFLAGLPQFDLWI